MPRQEEVLSHAEARISSGVGTSLLLDTFAL